MAEEQKRQEVSRIIESSLEKGVTYSGAIETLRTFYGLANSLQAIDTSMDNLINSVTSVTTGILTNPHTDAKKSESNLAANIELTGVCVKARNLARQIYEFVAPYKEVIIQEVGAELMTDAAGYLAQRALAESNLRQILANRQLLGEEVVRANEEAFKRIEMGGENPLIRIGIELLQQTHGGIVSSRREQAAGLPQPVQPPVPSEQPHPETLIATDLQQIRLNAHQAFVEALLRKEKPLAALYDFATAVLKTFPQYSESTLVMRPEDFPWREAYKKINQTGSIYDKIRSKLNTGSRLTDAEAKFMKAVAQLPESKGVDYKELLWVFRTRLYDLVNEVQEHPQELLKQLKSREEISDTPAAEEIHPVGLASDVLEPLPREKTATYQQYTIPRLQALKEFVHFWGSSNAQEREESLYHLGRIYIQTSRAHRNLDLEAEQMMKFDFKKFAQQLFQPTGTLAKLQANLQKGEQLTEVEDAFMQEIDFLRQGERMSRVELLKVFKSEITRYLDHLGIADISPKPKTHTVPSTKVETVRQDLKSVAGDVAKVEENARLQKEQQTIAQISQYYDMLMNAFPNATVDAQVPVKKFVDAWDSIGMTPNDVMWAFNEGYVTGRKEKISEKDLETRVISITQMITVLYAYFRMAENPKSQELQNVRTWAAKERNERIRSGRRFSESSGK